MIFHKKKFPELRQILTLERKLKNVCNVERLAEVKCGDLTFPIHAFSFGSTDKTTPVLGIFGGVHGLEKIGTHIALYYLRSFYHQLKWDTGMRERLGKVRIVFVPMVNPGGVFLNMRANPRGIDLMRNSPTVASEKVAWMVGGHRVSPKLPWYMGAEGDPMEIETQAVIDLMKRDFFPAKAIVTLDIHSGFGARDRLWYPYAKTRGPFPEIENVRRMSRLLRRAYPFNVYLVERQSKTYTTHGDLWDYLYDEHAKLGQNKMFLPWTLELGSWAWVKKNPSQVFSLLGGFNPMLPHRYRRIMRRHGLLLDFMLRATCEYEHWVES